MKNLEKKIKLIITLNENERENLYFILTEFVSTHVEGGLYKKEVAIATKIIKKIEL